MPVTPLTRFRIGSVSKPLTAAALGLLVERGELDLDAPVQEYVPDFPTKRWPITTRQVAGHVAGIRHYQGLEFRITRHYRSVEKSLSMGKTKDAERYALALTNQLMAAKVDGDHPTAVSCIQCLIALAEKTSSGIWLDRVFKLHAVHGWVMLDAVLEGLRVALNRIPRVPGSGIEDYEQTLRAMQREGALVPAPLLKAIAEFRDAFAGG